MAYATETDVADRLGRPLAGHEHTLAGALLGDAEVMLVDGVPNLADRADTDVGYRSRVVLVEATMVVRVLRNPGGYRTQAEGGSLASIDTRAAAGFLLVLDSEWDLLREADSNVFTIAPAFTEPTPIPNTWG